MSTPKPQIMLDTNVWLDVFVPGRNGSATATRLVRDAVEANATLLYSARILTDLFYEIRRDAAEWVRASAGSVSKVRSSWGSKNTMGRQRRHSSSSTPSTS